VAVRHGPPALLDFLRDQAASRGRATSGSGAVGYLALTLGNFFPPSSPWSPDGSPLRTPAGDTGHRRGSFSVRRRMVVLV
jgi:hypothetical protein